MSFQQFFITGNMYSYDFIQFVLGKRGQAILSKRKADLIISLYLSKKNRSEKLAASEI
jgi:hypothetical protein